MRNGAESLDLARLRSASYDGHPPFSTALPAEALAKAGGASGATRTPTECALNALPLPDWGTDAWNVVSARLRSTSYDGHPLLRNLPAEALRRRVEDQAGFEPALGVSHGIKSPVRSAATGTGPKLFRELRATSLKLEGHPASREAGESPAKHASAKQDGEPGRSRTSCDGVKSPAPFLWGFTLRVHVLVADSGGAPPRF